MDMSLDKKTVVLSKAGNDISKKLCGTEEVSAERTVVAAGAGAACGALASGAVVVAGVAAAPIAVPLTAAVAIGSAFFSLFD